MSKAKRNRRVGLFILSLILGLGLLLFLLGGSTKLLEARYTLYASWADVKGLKEGATVRLAGWDVGEVVHIEFAEGTARRLSVTLSIETKYQSKIRQCPSIDDQNMSSESSMARIDTVGVLGDKYVSLTMGGLDCIPIEDGQTIQTAESIDIVQYTQTVTEILGTVDSIANKVDGILGSDDEAGQASLARSFRHFEEITLAIKDGQLENGQQKLGLLHALIYDDTLRQRVDGTLKNIESSSASMRDSIDEIKSGDGLMHELIYGQEGARLASDLRGVSKAMTALLSHIENEESMLNSLIYDPESKQIVTNIKEASGQLVRISNELENGAGSAALFLRDPVLYEEIRTLVGGAQRNKLLRAYIRKAIEEAETQSADSFDTEEQP
ncbi:MAG: MlaD family protein [Myxococcota bacterium]